MKYLEQYKQVHRKKRYGWTGKRYIDDIAKTIPEGTKRLLDYGAGQSNLAQLLKQKLGLEDVAMYDPAVKAIEDKPNRTFDFVTCTDVMEHVPEEEIQDVLLDVFEYQERGALFIISLIPAGEILPNGENAHCTVKPKEWWEGKLSEVFAKVILVPFISKDKMLAAFYVEAS